VNQFQRYLLDEFVDDYKSGEMSRRDFVMKAIGVSGGLAAALGLFSSVGLSAAEIAQIAGRAGRHMSDGTFGTTADEGPLDPEIVAAVEEHCFEPLTQISWRNTRLRFDTVGALLRALDERPPAPGLVQIRDADDHRALQILSHNAEVMGLATHPAAVRLLWEVCQIPDFRKLMSDSHARFLAHCFLHLAGPDGRLPGAWVGAQMAQLDRLDGDIDTLMARIAHIRTWTYITHRGDWVEGAAEWQDRARGIEDRLSDALHDRITQRFVDRRSASSVRPCSRGRPHSSRSGSSASSGPAARRSEARARSTD